MTAADRCKEDGVYVPVTADEFLADAQTHIARNASALGARSYLDAFDILAHARAQVASQLVEFEGYFRSQEFVANARCASPVGSSEVATEFRLSNSQ
jgi:hypothetical protein